MIAGLSGSLLSHDALAERFVQGHPASPLDFGWFHSWRQQIARDMGPTSGARQVFDRIAFPLMTNLGLHVVPTTPSTGATGIHALLRADCGAVAILVTTQWGGDLGNVWREAIRTAIAFDIRWALCLNGCLLRIFDATHTYSRRFAQFDLDVVAQDTAASGVLAALLTANAFVEGGSALDRAVIFSEQHRAAVRTSLQGGVECALSSLLQAFAAARRRRARADLDALFDESLVVIYRILFLLFAEARGLVPKWHPVYRDSYTIESLRDATERLPRPEGLWESIQAISRLAHRGCRAGTLRVPPFNGRLFSPVHAPLAESLVLDDAAVREAMLALTTRQQGEIRSRIAYSDLGVEQLGGVYERILDYTPVLPSGSNGAVTVTRVGRRKSTGTFYTPRTLTEFMVRRALAPLTQDASAERILSLRVLDPSMGSGAFLVAACRYLANSYESALLREGALAPAGIDDSDRADFRRLIAQRCLFGVDINPMAVQLARLSLWLATLARNKPLTFLDHHLRVGNSLAGASIEDVVRGPARERRNSRPEQQLALFDLNRLDDDVHSILGSRMSLSLGADDTVEQVRAKEQLLSSLETSSPLMAWRRVADLWCATWFGSTDRGRQPKIFGPLVDEILGRPAVVPGHISKALLDGAQTIAERERFFHWQLEFPEVFDRSGSEMQDQCGFDAVIGNPPWEVLRGPRESIGDTALTAFSRRSGVYACQSAGHANLYQLFLERALALTRAGGRVAMVLPAGFAIDHGCARLRSVLINRASIDTFVTVENRNALFPIHRALKFVLLTATAGQPTRTVPCKAGIRTADDLERFPDIGDHGAIPLPRTLIEHLSGEQFAFPEIRNREDVEILGRTGFRFPALSSEDGWNIHFGRELNATDDRKHFIDHPTPDGLRVIEGKHIQPFVVHLDSGRDYIPRCAATRLLRSAEFRRPRLAYRDVASASNRLTLIAAIVPANVVTTHTLFCVKGNVGANLQLFLCGILNSFVANYLVRMRVGTHVSVSIIERLPVPRPAIDSVELAEIVTLVRRVVTTPTSVDAMAELQAAAARLYDLQPREFQHVLDTFPLVSVGERQKAMEYFRRRT